MLQHVLNSLHHVKSGDSKCILLAVRLIQALVKKTLETPRLDEACMARLAAKLKEFLEHEFAVCSSELDGDGPAGHERQDNQRPSHSESPRGNISKWDHEAHQAAREVSRSIPHFAVRLAACLDDLAASQKADSPIRKLREAVLGFSFCKRLVTTLFKVVGKERRAIVTERPIFTRTSHDLQMDGSNSLDHELKLDDDIINWRDFEPELDRFNKESVMSGLKFLAKRLHALPDSEAAYVFENIQWLPVALVQYRACDYVIEEVDELIRILVQVEPG